MDDEVVVVPIVVGRKGGGFEPKVAARLGIFEIEGQSVLPAGCVVGVNSTTAPILSRLGGRHRVDAFERRVVQVGEQRVVP